MPSPRETMQKFTNIVESPTDDPVSDSQKRSRSNLSRKRAKAAGPVEPMTIKLDVVTRRHIFQEVARRKADKLANRTIQGVVADAVAQLIGGKKEVKLE